ncbi:MAG: carbohydrate ABC transporter permease [Oscillospiraceae bacterium]|nr:carbohydrate ABC transporter permease [Oscillospiraceae bacterium]
MRKADSLHINVRPHRPRLLRRHRNPTRSYGGDAFINLLLILLGFFMALPFIYTISNAFKPFDELWVYPPRFFPRIPTTKNFRDLFRLLSNSDVPFLRYVFNTLFISVAGTGGHLILASSAAYAMAKMRFRGRNAMFRMVELSLMFNAPATAIITYIIMSRLGLVDNYAAYILPAFAGTLGLYLMKQFMEQMIPDAILEAARIDGAGELRIIGSIVLPMVKPAWMTLIIFSFFNLWNTGASVMVYTEELKTFNYAVSQIIAGGIARAGTGSAATLVMMLVPITVFLFAQSNVMETMSASGMKD